MTDGVRQLVTDKVKYLALLIREDEEELAALEDRARFVADRLDFNVAERQELIQFLEEG